MMITINVIVYIDDCKWPPLLVSNFLSIAPKVTLTNQSRARKAFSQSALGTLLRRVYKAEHTLVKGEVSQMIQIS